MTAVFCVVPQLTTYDDMDAEEFKQVLEEQLNNFGICYFEVNFQNINKLIYSLDNESVVILFNGNGFELSNDVKRFLETAIIKEANICPVALGKQTRLPDSIISEYQSYDVVEQLRSRNLGKDYLPMVAKAFSRKIIGFIMPTLYTEKWTIFVSHRRLDGEEITARLCDCIIKQSKAADIFRDIAKVDVGDKAQKVIDIAMKASDVFIFIHTWKSAGSPWIQKELRYAVVHNIPVLWVNIDGADSQGLEVLPSDKPNLYYQSSMFKSDENIAKISDEILQTAFVLVMSRTDKVFDYINSLKSLFWDNIQEYSKRDMLYSVSVPRKGYHYPQRNIVQYFQIFGRNINNGDIENLKIKIQDCQDYDSAVVLTDKVIKFDEKNGIVIDSLENYYYNWKRYFEFKKDRKNMEIVISGAFPDSDEIYKQSLSDAVIIFARSILKDGYILTFGSHPTFQKLFFEIAREELPDRHREGLKMYISRWFEKEYITEKSCFTENAQLFEIEKENSITESLEVMRRKMIQRDEVAALLCLGGKIKPDKKDEGIREEIEIAKEYGIPVFIVGTTGGSSAEAALEYKNKGWKNINNASNRLNEMFMGSADYFNLSNALLDYIDKSRNI